MKRKSKKGSGKARSGGLSGAREAGYRLVEAVDAARARAGTVFRIAALALVALGVVTEERRRRQPKPGQPPSRDEPERPRRPSRRGAA